MPPPRPGGRGGGGGGGGWRHRRRPLHPRRATRWACSARTYCSWISECMSLLWDWKSRSAQRAQLPMGVSVGPSRGRSGCPRPVERLGLEQHAARHALGVARECRCREVRDQTSHGHHQSERISGVKSAEVQKYRGAECRNDTVPVLHSALCTLHSLLPEQPFLLRR